MAHAAVLFEPGSAEAARAFFAQCTEARARGAAIRLMTVESPYVAPTPENMAAAVHSDPDEGFSALRGAAAGGDVLGLVTHRRLNVIHEVSREDYLAVVDGGVRLSDFAKAVDGEELFFPHEFDCLTREATVAELIMDGPVFPTEGRFGALRESILSIELVLPGGEAVHSGSRAVKDVTGYDIPAFILGQGGRCGLVSKVTFRLLPKPRARALFAARGNAKELRALAARIHRSPGAAFLRIFEGEAARLFALAIEAHAASGAHPATEEHPAPELHAEPEMEALLVGEIHGAEAGFEPAFGNEGPAVRIMSPNFREDLLTFPWLAAEKFDERAGILCISYDDGSVKSDIPGALVSGSLYPERVCVMAALDAADAGPDGAPDLAAAMRSSPALRALLAKLNGAWCRERFEIMRVREGRLERRRIHADEIARGLAGGHGAAGTGATEILGGAPGRDEAISPRARQAAPFKRLTEAVFKVFDPKGIMLP